MRKDALLSQRFFSLKRIRRKNVITTSAAGSEGHKQIMRPVQVSSARNVRTHSDAKETLTRLLTSFRNVRVCASAGFGEPLSQIFIISAALE